MLRLRRLDTSCLKTSDTECVWCRVNITNVTLLIIYCDYNEFNVANILRLCLRLPAKVIFK